MRAHHDPKTRWANMPEIIEKDGVKYYRRAALSRLAQVGLGSAPVYGHNPIIHRGAKFFALHPKFAEVLEKGFLRSTEIARIVGEKASDIQVVLCQWRKVGKIRDDQVVQLKDREMIFYSPEIIELLKERPKKESATFDDFDEIDRLLEPLIQKYGSLRTVCKQMPFSCYAAINNRQMSHKKAQLIIAGLRELAESQHRIK